MDLRSSSWVACALWLIAPFAVGCTETGLMLEVQGPAGTTSVAMGVTKLDFVVAHESWCERYVFDASATHTRVDVSGRDLQKHPYDLLLKPAHATDLSQAVVAAALAYDNAGQLLGEAVFGVHSFIKSQVLLHAAQITPLAAGPKYVAGDGGCVCLPGLPWMGNGSGSGCDTRVITSFARLGDTAGCELPAGSPVLQRPVCDGQLYDGVEVERRQLPCFASDDAGSCRVHVRECADNFGIAYQQECRPNGGDPALLTDALCKQYLGCQSACGDVIGCFTAAAPMPSTIKCTLPIDPTTAAGQPIVPCANGSWKTDLVLPQQLLPNCAGALLEGTRQPPFTLGFSGANGVQPVAAHCLPLTLEVQKIDSPYPEAVPAAWPFLITVGDRLVQVTLEVTRSCADTPSLVCSPIL
jgi:hypothetical protein